MPNSSRFYSLDAARGIAALLILTYHYSDFLQTPVLPTAWVAVDFFFVLSGFVIAASYGTKLTGRMSFPEFFLVRLRRFSTVYYASFLFGITALLMQMLQTSAFTPYQLLAAIGLNALWMPYPNEIAWPFGNEMRVGLGFPTNNPAWSLSFELIVNIVVGMYVVANRKWPGFKSAAAVYLLFIIGSGVTRTLNPGWRMEHLWLALPRALGEFLIGACIFNYNLHKRFFPKPLVMLTVIVCLSIPSFNSGWSARLNSMVLLPLLVVMLSTVSPTSSAVRRFCSIVGDLSFPLYAIHFPVLMLLTSLSAFNAMSQTHQLFVALPIALLVGHLLSIFEKRQRAMRTSAGLKAERIDS